MVCAALTSCGTGTQMGYRWPEPARWERRTVPPHVVALPPGGYHSDYVLVTQYQLEECERIAAAYSERATLRVRSGTVLSGLGGFSAGLGVALVGVSQAVDTDSSARSPLLWAGLSVGVVGAALSLWETFSGTSQASAYNDAAARVRSNVDDFLMNVRNQDTVAGELLTARILVERVCSLREQCRQSQFDVSIVGHHFSPSGARETSEVTDAPIEKKLEAMCTAGWVPPEKEEQSKPPASASGDAAVP